MIIYKGSNRKVKTAVGICNNEEFLKDLREAVEKRQYFDMSSTEPGIIWDRIESFLADYPANVYLQRGWFWSKWLAKFKFKYPYNMYLNSGKLNRSVESIVGSIIHELVHMVDFHDYSDSYGHGSNSRKGKEDTAPYAIGEMAKSIAKYYV